MVVKAEEKTYRIGIVERVQARDVAVGSRLRALGIECAAASREDSVSTSHTQCAKTCAQLATIVGTCAGHQCFCSFKRLVAQCLLV